MHNLPVSAENTGAATAVAIADNSGVLLSRPLRRALYIALPLWFVLALAWLAPAQLLPALLQGALPQLQLGSVAGSFWHGRAANAQWQDQQQTFALGAVEWRLSPWSLLLLHPRVEVSSEFGEQFIAAKARLSPLGAVALHDVRVAVPAASLRMALPIPVEGLITLQLPQLSLHRDGTLETVAGELQWQRAAWQWEHRWLPLGDYRCQLQSAAAGQLHCQLDGGSAARISGAVDVDLTQRRYRIDGELLLSDELPSSVRDGAGLLLGGDPVGNDGGERWHIERQGSW